MDVGRVAHSKHRRYYQHRATLSLASQALGGRRSREYKCARIKDKGGGPEGGFGAFAASVVFLRDSTVSATRAFAFSSHSLTSMRSSGQNPLKLRIDQAVALPASVCL